MPEPTPLRRASATKALPPPSRQVEESLASKLGDEGKTLHLLLQHARGGAFWRGLAIGAISGILFGMVSQTLSLREAIPIAVDTLSRGLAVGVALPKN